MRRRPETTGAVIFFLFDNFFPDARGKIIMHSVDCWKTRSDQERSNPASNVQAFCKNPKGAKLAQALQKPNALKYFRLSKFMGAGYLIFFSKKFLTDTLVIAPFKI